MAEISSVSPSSRPTLRQHFKDFAGYTTLHGLHFVFDSYGIVRRLIWVILILIGLGFCVEELIRSYSKLTAYDYVITKAIRHSQKLTFPAVTICNVNMMKKSKILGTDAQLYLDQLNANKPVHRPGQLYNQTLNSTFDIKEAVKKYGHIAKRMILLCVWNGKKCSHLNFTTHYSYLHGLCHKFNPGKDGHPLVYSKSNKPTLGLILVLDTEKSEHYGMMSYFKAGMRVLVHKQNDKPNIEDDGIDIMPGYMTSIRFQKTQIESLPPPFQSACGSRKLETSKIYTRSVCMHECQTRQVIKQCGCKLLGMPDLQEYKGTKHCSPKQMNDCGLYSTTPFVSKSTNQDVIDISLLMSGYVFSSNFLIMGCECPIPCTQIEYTTTRINTAYFITNLFLTDLVQRQVLPYWKQSISNQTMEKAYIKKQKEEIIAKSKDFVHLTVNPEDLNTYITKEKRSYDFNDFGGKIININIENKSTDTFVNLINRFTIDTPITPFGRICLKHI